MAGCLYSVSATLSPTPNTTPHNSVPCKSASLGMFKLLAVHRNPEQTITTKFAQIRDATNIKCMWPGCRLLGWRAGSTGASSRQRVSLKAAGVLKGARRPKRHHLHVARRLRVFNPLDLALARRRQDRHDVIAALDSSSEFWDCRAEHILVGSTVEALHTSHSPCRDSPRRN